MAYFSVASIMRSKEMKGMPSVYRASWPAWAESSRAIMMTRAASSLAMMVLQWSTCSSPEEAGM